jgi:hypothetical protein
MAPWLALLLWKPIAVAGMFAATRAYVRRSLSGLWERRAALALGLFFGSFSIVYGSVSVVGDLFPGFLSWGYPFGLMAIAAMLLALVAYERGRRANALVWTPGVLGALASSLHPWQGELMIVLVLGAELLHWRERAMTWRRLSLPLATVAATAVPLVYYVILGRLDLSWTLARVASKHSFSFWSIALALAPLALLATLGYRTRPRTFLDTITRIWPLAALVIYLISASGLSATPLHAFEGITVPLAVLAVDGVRRTGWERLPHRRLVGAAAIAAATIPANAFQLSIAHEFMAPTPGNANFITREERSALNYLRRDREKGGVLTRFYLGAVVPAKTGRRTFVGNCLWSQPGCAPRAQLVQKLFDGTLGAKTARRFVRESGARFVLADCQSSTDLTRVLFPLLVSVKRFGCATVYELDGPHPPTGPLAESARDAAVRAPRRQ